MWPRGCQTSARLGTGGELGKVGIEERGLEENGDKKRVGIGRVGLEENEDLEGIRRLWKTREKYEVVRMCVETKSRCGGNKKIERITAK